MDEFLNLRLGYVVQSASAAYSCLQRLGHGGSAETYLVISVSGPLRGQLFAMKVFRRLSKPDWRTNFLDEIRFLQTCDHPAVMRVFDEGLHQDEHPFVVAEYLPRTMGDVLRGRPTMMEKLGFAMQLISALEYLSSPDISVVHRDIKPANVFIKGSSCVLGDFGLIKRTQTPRPADFDQELMKGSLGLGPRMPRSYRTPDLISYLNGGPAPTVKSDIYQLGLLFGELFSGWPIQRPMRDGNFSSPIELNSYFVPGGNGLAIKLQVERMLADSPESRPGAADLFQDWLNIFMVAARQANALEGRAF